MIYVDETVDYEGGKIPLAARRHGTKFCHLVADTHGELEEFAKKLGLDSRHIQRVQTVSEHYDLTPNMRDRALRFGAKEITKLELIGLVRRKRAAL